MIKSVLYAVCLVACCISAPTLTAGIGIQEKSGEGCVDWEVNEFTGEWLCMGSAGGGAGKCKDTLPYYCSFTKEGIEVEGRGPLPSQPLNCLFYEVPKVGPCELISNISNCKLGCAGNL